MKEIIDPIISGYDNFIHPDFQSKFITHSVLEKEFERFSDATFLDSYKIGESIEGRSIRAIKFGNGNQKILIWTQMHGNETTATRAVFDFFNALLSKENEDYRLLLKEKIELLIVPMLNPDGAERYQRRNALNIDPNRDAVKRETPEIRTLFELIDDFKPNWCFNMHDQRNLFNPKDINKPATISFLSPSTCYDKKMTKTKSNSAKLIAALAKQLNLKNKVGVARFSDEFYSTATGDNIQLMGINTILIESGGHLNDFDRMEARRLVFESFIYAFELIGTEDWKNVDIENYFSIPINDSKFFDILIKNVFLISPINPTLKIKADIGIENVEYLDKDTQELKIRSTIKDIGDLSNYFGYQEIDATSGSVKTTLELNKTSTFKIEFAKRSTIFINNGHIE